MRDIHAGVRTATGSGIVDIPGRDSAEILYLLFLLQVCQALAGDDADPRGQPAVTRRRSRLRFPYGRARVQAAAGNRSDATVSAEGNTSAVGWTDGSRGAVSRIETTPTTETLRHGEDPGIARELRVIR